MGVGFGVGFGVIVRVGVGFGVRVGVGFAVGEGVTWETFSVKVVEFASQKPLAACVRVMVAVPAFPTVTLRPATEATLGSLDIKLQIPGDFEVGGVI